MTLTTGFRVDNIDNYILAETETTNTDLVRMYEEGLINYDNVVENGAIKTLRIDFMTKISYPVKGKYNIHMRNKRKKILAITLIVNSKEAKVEDLIFNAPDEHCMPLFEQTFNDMIRYIERLLTQNGIRNLIIPCTGDFVFGLLHGMGYVLTNSQEELYKHLRKEEMT